MRIVFVRPALVENHPLDMRACLSAPADMDIVVVPSEAVEQMLTSEQGLKLHSPFRFGKSTRPFSPMAFGNLRHGDRTFSRTMGAGTFRSILRHADRIVVCDETFSRFDMPEFLSALGEVSRNAECMIHAFVHTHFYDTFGVPFIQKTPRETLALQTFRQPPHADGSPRFYASTLRDAVRRLRAFRRVVERIEGSSGAYHYGNEMDTLGIFDEQTLYWAQRNGGWPSKRSGRYPFDFADGALFWKHHAKRLQERAAIGMNEAAPAYGVTDRTLKTLEECARDDPDFGARLRAWCGMTPADADREIAAFMAEITKKRQGRAAA